jgi:membrane protein involved in colicin uptake
MRINWGYVVGGVVGLGVCAAVAAGVVVAVGSAQTSAAQPDTVVALDYGADYDRAAAVTAATADRDARAAAEAARVAAEQAAAEAAAIVAAAELAAEEAAQGDVSDADGEASNGEEAGGASGGVPAVWIDLGNGSGMWDFSHCPTQSGSTGADGNVYCN